MKPTEVTQALKHVVDISHHGAPAMETSFGSHSTGRPRQIRTLLALLTEYWRLEPALQLHELLERLVPSGALPLDGPKRDDAALIAALRAMPQLREAVGKLNATQPRKAPVALGSPDAHRFATFDTHLRQLHKTLLSEHLASASQLDQELDAGDTSVCGYDVNIRLFYLATEPRPGQESSRDPTLAIRDVVWPFDIEPESVNFALQAIDANNYAESGSSCPKGFLTHQVVTDAQGTSPALGEAGLLRADRVWVDFMVTRQYCLELESGVFQKMHPQEPMPETNATR